MAAKGQGNIIIGVAFDMDIPLSFHYRSTR